MVLIGLRLHGLLVLFWICCSDDGFVKWVSTSAFGACFVCFCLPESYPEQQTTQSTLPGKKVNDKISNVLTPLGGFQSDQRGRGIQMFLRGETSVQRGGEYCMKSIVVRKRGSRELMNTGQCSFSWIFGCLASCSSLCLQVPLFL
jgi:hypothetical protein